MKKFVAKAASALLSALFLFSLSLNSVSASTVKVSPSAMNGWNINTTSSAVGQFVTGPGSHSGSLRFFSNGDGNSIVEVNTSNHVGVLLSSITTLEYFTYGQSTTVTYPKLILNLNTVDGTDPLTFVPAFQSQTPAPGVWQSWNTMNGTWRSARSNFATEYPNQTLSDYVLFDPSASIINAGDGSGGLLFKAASSDSSDIYDANVDNFTIGVNGLDTTYNFEPDTVPIPAPIVTTSAAGFVLSTSATLNGSANPNGDATTGWFRYATVDPVTCNNSFGTSTGVSSLGSGTSDVPYSQAISGLTSGTTYYYCAIASNGGGTGFGSVSNLTTPVPVPATKGDCMNGKWQTYLIFKSQGECIKFVH